MKAYVVGSLNMDMVFNVSRMPEQGETMFADSYFHNCGGKGANQAIACAKLGSDVSMIGKVGMDSHGQTMIENLRKNNVDVSAVTVSEKSISGTAFIIVEDGDNRIILEKGANEQIE
ncbi:MAG TPA: ribokinase, partial [Clostridiales bacterium]|nr:ribokinase [Clostridiales bacterium]